MAKEIAILAVSVITLFVAGFAAFGVYDLDKVPSQSAAAQIKDYTAEFESIQSALESVNQKLETLESETIEELKIIKSELAEVKLTVTRPPPIDTSSPFGISLDKTVYSKGDSIVIFAHNILPQKAMTIQLLSSFNELITTVTARSDSTGKLNYVFQIPSFVPAGDYKIKAVTADGSNDMMFFTISDQTGTPTNPTSIITGLTVKVDKSVYAPGDMITVTGFGEASSAISAELVSPTQKIATAHSTISSDSTYTLIFILDNDAKPGNWKLKIVQDDEEESLTFSVKTN